MPAPSRVSGRDPVGRAYLAERTAAPPASMKPRTDRATLATVHAPALRAPPCVSAQGLDHRPQAMRLPQHQPVPLDRLQLALKIGPVVRATLEDIILPLMDHLMREGAEQFVCRLRAQQGQRELDAAAIRGGVGVPRAGAVDEETGGGRQPRAPDDGNARQTIGEIAHIEFLPERAHGCGRWMRGHRCEVGCDRRPTVRFCPGQASSSRIAAASNGTMISWCPTSE